MTDTKSPWFSAIAPGLLLVSVVVASGCGALGDSLFGPRNYDRTVCGPDGACPAGLVCNAQNLCVLPGSETTVDVECTSRCDCAPGEVCRSGACSEPPAECAQDAECPRGPDDRCEAFTCNLFTRQCIDLNPPPCTTAADCSGRPGCTADAVCACTSSGTCVPDAACTPQDEATTCGATNYCDGNGDCQARPACTQPADCTGFGLACNADSGFCERPVACATTTECTVAPNTFCDAATGFCTLPTCVNGGVTCENGLECSQGSGRCVPPSTGTSCTANANCPDGQYCDFPDQTCRVGCRDNLDCPNGDNCDGTHTCVGGGSTGTGQFGDSCADDTGCAAPLICTSFSGTCTDACSLLDDSCPTCTAVHGTCTCFLIGCGPG
jgi:hypothetical protein